MTQLSSVVLHSYYQSSSAWRVRIVLELKALPYSLSPVNLKPGVDEQHQAEFKQRSALMQVPVLEARLGGEQLRLTQSLAIIDLLERVVPTPPLYPAEPRERAWALEAAELVPLGAGRGARVHAPHVVGERGARVAVFAFYQRGAPEPPPFGDDNQKNSSTPLRAMKTNLRPAPMTKSHVQVWWA